MEEIDEYHAKLKSLKKYVPFLVNMMADLKNKGNREAQLNKIQSLHDMITDDRKKLKLETLNRCEEVLTNIYIKVNPQIKNKTPLAPPSPTQTIEVPDSPPRDVDETPRSPSPERSDDLILTSRPVTIPTEKVLDSGSKGSNYGSSRSRNIPKIDIYGAAAFDILLEKRKESPPPAINVPDISKPPISIDDLKNLEDDVQDKIAAVQLTARPIDELEKYKKELELQLRVENVSRTLSATEINTTVRNKLDLSQVKKIKEAKFGKNSQNDGDNPKSNKVASKVMKVSPTRAPGSPTVASRIQKLSNEEKEKSKDEKDKKSGDKDYKRDKEKSKKDDRKEKDRERSKDKKSDHKDKDKSKKRDESRDKRDRSSDSKRDSSSSKSDSNKKDDSKKKMILNRDNATNDLKSRLLIGGALKFDEGSQSSTDSSSSKETVKKSQIISNKEPRKSFEEQLAAPEQQLPLKRLADKYNPKPRKPSSDDFDKIVLKSIEKSMKVAPAKADILEKLSESTKIVEKTPIVNKLAEPIPPPPSLVRLAMNRESPEQPTPKTVQLPDILQKIFQKANQPTTDAPPKKTDPRLEGKKGPVDPRRRNDPPKPPPLLSRDPLSQMEMAPPPSLLSKEVGPPLISPPQRNYPPILSPPQSGVGMVSPTQTFLSPKGFAPSQAPALLPNPGTGRYQQSNLSYPSNVGGLEFVPPSPLVDFICPSPRVDFEIPPSPIIDPPQRYIPPDFLDTPVRPPFQNVNFLNREQFLNDKVTQPMFGGTNNSMDQPNKYDLHRLSQYELHNQSVNFYQVNNSYNNLAGMPVLQPELPHLMPEPKPYLMEPYLQDMRQPRGWREERRPGDPRNYREYREKREREERERRERERERDKDKTRDPRVSADSTDREPRGRSRGTKDEECNRDRSKSRNRRERSLERGKDRDKTSKDVDKEKPTKFEKSKFDKMYSTANRDRSRSRSKSGSEEDVFVSPLDSLYAGKDEKRTGRGYGMQSFRIPKKRKEERESRAREKDRGREKQSKSSKKPARRIESDEEDNDIADNLSDAGTPSDNEALSDQEPVQTEQESEKDTSKQPEPKEKVVTKRPEPRKKPKKKTTDVEVIEEPEVDDSVVVIKDEEVEEKKKKTIKKEPVVKIEDSESEEVIEIKDEEHEERRKSLRKKKPVPKSPVVSPTKRQPARKAKKNAVPLPIAIKFEDDDVEEIPSEFEVIDIDDDETQKEIEELEASQIAECTKETQPISLGATNEELDLFVSEYVLEVSGDVNKCFKSLETVMKQEIIYETESLSATKQMDEKVTESSNWTNKVSIKPPKTIQSKAKGPKKSCSIEEEAKRRIEVIKKLSQATVAVTEKVAEPEAQNESETDVAMRELSELLETTNDQRNKPMEVEQAEQEPENQQDKTIESVLETEQSSAADKEPVTPDKQPEMVATATEQSITAEKQTENATTVTESSLTSDKLATVTQQTISSDEQPEKVDSVAEPPTVLEKQPEIEQPAVKATEVEVQEPTSSQDVPKPVEDEKTEKNESTEVAKSTELEKENETPNESVEPETSKNSEDPAEVNEPNILAHFFENLLKSKNKQDKKTALFSLIQTFSDSFTGDELNKITKIIRADQGDDKASEEPPKKEEPEKTEAKEETVVQETRPQEEEAPVVGSTTEEEIPSIKLSRIRRLSSTTTEEENPDCDTSDTNTKKVKKISQKKDTVKSTEISAEEDFQEPVLVSVGERIKNRKRNMPSVPKGKKHKTELDRIHEDIKEMFIRDGVLTATGKRMSRMLKEDPNALSPTNSDGAISEHSNIRKKPVPKPKPHQESKNLRDVRIVLSKIPDNKFKVQNRRVLRSNRSSSIADDGATESNFGDDSEESDSESSESSDPEDEQEEEEDKKSQTSETTNLKPKLVKKKKKVIKSAWAMGIIKKFKKKTQNKSKENSPERTMSPELDNNASLEEDLDKLFVEPDKNYYYDPNDKKKMTCKLCDFVGMFITTHYLKEHPHSEVLCSRFSPEMAKDAKKDYQRKKKRYAAIINKRLGLKYNYSCRFCGFSSQQQPIFFYEHCTTHTGEYRHQCGICHFYSVTAKTLNQHFLNAHPGEKKNAVRESYTKAIVYGYLCGECNYVQLKENAIEEHINIYHLGDKPKIYKVNMSKIVDPALEDHKTDLIVTPSTTKAIEPVIKPKEEEETKKDDSIEETQPNKKIKKATKKLEETTEESITDSDVSEQKKDPQPPKPKRKPGPKSKTKTQEVITKPPEIPSETETEEQKIITPPPVRRKPGPKSKTRKQPPIAPVETSESENLPDPETTDSEIAKDNNESSASEDLVVGQKPAKILRKRRSLEALICKENGEDLDTVIALSSRSSRAAKEKAGKQIKFFIETNEGSPRKLKALANEQKARKSVEEPSKTVEKEKDDKSDKDADKEIDTLQPAEKETKAKQTDTNVFTCNADSLQDEKRIEEERLKKMDELNKVLNPRSSKLDFVEKLSNRLTNEDQNTTVPPVKIKDEPKDADNSFERPETPMPVLEKQVEETTTPVIPSPGRSVLKSNLQSSPAAKKPTLEDSTPMTSVNVNLRSNSLFPDIIQKLQGKVGPPQQESTEAQSDSNEPTQYIKIGELIKATKQGNAIVFSCHAANCYVSTKDRMVFQLHCKFGHKDLTLGEACLCDKCGVKVTSTPDTTLMENLYDHLMYAHSDFIDVSPKPRMLRMRRLSGDKLSIKREEEDIKKEKPDEEPSDKPENTPTPMDMSGVEPVIPVATQDTLPMDTSGPPEPTTPVAEGTLELSADNPFTFKIAQVMSLADAQGSPVKQSVPTQSSSLLKVSPVKKIVASPETIQKPDTPVTQISSPQKMVVVAQKTPVQQTAPRAPVFQPPPLTLIDSKQPKPTTQHQLKIKEAKLTQAELNKPRKAPKAMSKFIETQGDLYKCPHYYCLFTTNFRAFLERHLKAHKSDSEVMIPCVYCDMKTPWEHVPMHIDIRHAQCRFACQYCLYRSCLKEYVCLHQDSQHPGQEYAVVQLPPPKSAKKFSVADLKIEPKSLCEPFVCICPDGTKKEYLYENEFDQRLKMHYPPHARLQCHYPGCTAKVPTSFMITHWSTFHGVSTYQCGYCKMSSKDMVQMYYHFSQFHQWLAPDILVRIGDYVLDISKELGYSAEAFDRLAHITNLPSNILTTLKKTKGTKSIKLIQLAGSTTSQPPQTQQSDVNEPTVDNSTPNNVVGSPKAGPPPMTSLVHPTNRNIQLIVTSSSDSANLVVVPGTITQQTANIQKTPPKIVSTVKKPVVTSEKSTGNVAPRSSEAELVSLRALMCPNVTVVSTKHSIISRSSSPIITKPIMSSVTSTERPKTKSKDIINVLPPGISLTTMVPSDKGDESSKTVVSQGTKVDLPTGISWKPVVESADSVGQVQVPPETAPTPIRDLDSLSPILLPEPDEASLDEPLFDNIDINTDSPVVDPLSIEPTIHEVPSEDPMSFSEDPIAPIEDPLSVPTVADPLSAEHSDGPVLKRGRPPRVQRSVSNVSTSDEESTGQLDKTGLQGYQLYRCAICSISFATPKDFKQHVNQSVMCRKAGKYPYQCVHCNKLIKTAAKLLSHIQIHGILRYSCSLCSMKFAVSFSARMHMKNRHQITQSTSVPLLPGKTNYDTDHFIVRPVLALPPPLVDRDRSNSGRESAGESPSKSGGEGMSFLPDQINDIPIRQIFTQNAKCGLCNYQTKVRVNIVRHLQMHSDDRWVPDTAPVNPVPCLEKNEKMFDKMVNLASSSMESRMGGAKVDKEKEEERIPEYVPSHCRFICCAQGCTYLCQEEGNLRHHIMALHSDETDFNCGHCKNKIEPPDVESVIKHLKLHGLHLYQCKYCVFIHNQKHKVERHVSDNHNEAAVKVVTIRQMDFEQDNDRSVEIVKDVNVNKSRNWKCCFCKYATTTEDNVKNHISTKHNCETQFKCALCSYKSNEKYTFSQHFKDKHHNTDLDVIYVYQYLEDEVPKEDDTHVDTTPLWQRDKPRVRHIRGILFDESAPPQPTKSPKSKGIKPGPSGIKSVNSKNLFDAIDSVARGSKAAKPVKTYSRSNKDDPYSFNDAISIQNEVVKKIVNNKEFKKPTTESDPLKLDAKIVSIKSPKRQTPKPTTVPTPTFVPIPENEPPPLLYNIESENDVKDVLPSVEEINKVKQGSDDPIIIIDDDDDVIVVPKAPVESRGKKRAAGTTDLLQEALKMAKIDEESRTDVDDEGALVSEYSEDNLKKLFGEFGGPNNRQWKCPLCLQFRSKRISDFIFHIFKDLNVFRYRCKSCKDESITFKYMIGHIKSHFEPLTEDDIEMLAPNNKLEAWIQMVLREQSIVINNNIKNLSKPIALVDENIACMFCSERFPNAAEASEHMLKHWITKPYLCMYCPSDFYTRFELRHHQAVTHPTLKQVLNNVSPTVSEAMHRFDDGFRKRPLATTSQDFPVAKKMKLNEDPPAVANDVINIVSVNDILKKGNVLDAQPGTSASQDSDAAINLDSDSDELVVVTKTDEFIPNEDDVYACTMCAYVADTEQIVTQHLERQHGHKAGTKFRILNKKEEETSSHIMACNACHQIFSELKLRLHFLDNHQSTHSYSPYVYTCNLCSARFLMLRSIKKHFSVKHQHLPLNYKTIDGYSLGTKSKRVASSKAVSKKSAKTLKTPELRQYQCVLCEFTLESVNTNQMKNHLKSMHCKPFECCVCHERSRTESEAVTHHTNNHDKDTLPNFKVLDDVLKQYLESMRLIIKMSLPVNRGETREDDEGEK